MDKLSAALNRVETLLGSEVSAARTFGLMWGDNVKKMQEHLKAARKRHDTEKVKFWTDRIKKYKKKAYARTAKRNNELRKHYGRGKLLHGPSAGRPMPASAITASFETWEAAHRILAAFKPNLHKLQKLISRGLITPQEVSDALVEALRGKGVSLHLVLAIKDVLVEALGGDLGDVIDVEPGVGQEGQGPVAPVPGM